MGECKNPDCEAYPYYGPAPHDCYYKIGKNIGESKVHDRATWPSNFIEDTDDGPTSKPCGTYVCPDCRSGL